MTKKLALALGSLMLLDGVVNTLNPRLAFRLWDRYYRRCLPAWTNSMTEDYERLSDTTMRLIAGYEALAGLMLLWTASRIRD